MDILHLLYTGKENRTLHLLYLGNRNDKICGLEITSISPHDRNQILKKLSDLKEYTLDKRIIWLKSHCTSFSKGYKEIYTKNIKVLARYPIKL